MQNGKNNIWIIRTLVGFLFTIIFFAVTTLASHVIANDKDCRERNIKVDDRLHKAVLEQQQQNAETNVTLEKILVTLEYIKNGR